MLDYLFFLRHRQISRDRTGEPTFLNAPLSRFILGHGSVRFGQNPRSHWGKGTVYIICEYLSVASYSFQVNNAKDYCLLECDATVFWTSDLEMPNSRAIRVGDTPALNAAKTAFTLP